jgi:membrane associated rhomboid family serine protease/Flp pilus assembly protein TadD
MEDQNRFPAAGAVNDPALREAEELLDAERYGAALALFRRAQAHDARAASGMAAAYAGLAEFDKARDAVREALARDPREARALAVAGYLADMVEGAPQRAADLLRAAVVADPTSAYARYRLGMLLLKYEHFDEAQSELAQARALNPRMWRAALALSRFAPTGAERARQARAAYRAGLRVNRADPRLWLGLLRALLRSPFAVALGGQAAPPSTELAQRQRLAVQALFGRPFRPLLTYTIIAINTVMLIVLELNGGATNTDTLVQYGAMVGPLVRAGDWWRLLTAMVLHAGFLHYALNNLFLWVMGPLVERLFGRPRMLFIYIFAGVSGNLASYLHGTLGPSVGASTALFGLLGALAVFFGRERGLLGSVGQRQFQGIVVTAVLNLIIDQFIPQIDTAAHVGGLLGGIVAGLALMPHYRVETAAVAAGPDVPARAPVLSDRRSQAALIVEAALLTLVLVGVIYFTIYR